MNMLLWLTAITLAVAVAAFFAYAFITGARRMLRDDGPLRLGQVLRARGLPLPNAGSPLEVAAAAQATRRCLACSEQHRCDIAIAERDWDRLAEICPNHGYIEGRARQQTTAAP